MKVGERSPTSHTYTNFHLISLTFTNYHAPMSLSTNSIVFESIVFGHWILFAGRRWRRPHSGSGASGQPTGRRGRPASGRSSRTGRRSASRCRLVRLVDDSPLVHGVLNGSLWSPWLILEPLAHFGSLPVHTGRAAWQLAGRRRRRGGGSGDDVGCSGGSPWDLLRRS